MQKKKTCPSSSPRSSQGRGYIDLLGQQLVDGKLRFTYHPDTTVGVVGMAGLTATSVWIAPTRSLKRIITSIKDGDIIRFGGYLDLIDVLPPASFRLGDTGRQQRIVFFAGGEVCHPLVDAQVLGTQMKLLDQACDVISFGDPYMGKRKFFDTLIRFADNNGNCNICHVPPESSVLEAISRSHSFFIPRVGGQPSILQYTKKEIFEAIARSHILIPRESKTRKYHDKKKPIDVYLKPPSDGADPNTDCPFCQTLLLTLKEKGVSYNTHFIDLLNKPTWFPKQNGLETLPLIKFHGGTWISNSDVIVGMIDKKYEGRSLETPPNFAY
ncbi:dehydroascorbate reductase 2, partial [Tanacetum coccineum]